MMTRDRVNWRELAYCGVLGTVALLLPLLFQLARLGHVLTPMYLPIVTLAFFVRPLPAAVTALIVPPISASITKVPLLYPPVALFMALELATISASIAAAVRRWPRINRWLVLILVLLAGRALYVGLTYGFSLLVGFPTDSMVGFSSLKGWLSSVLMIVVVPPLVRYHSSIGGGGQHHILKRRHKKEGLGEG